MRRSALAFIWNFAFASLIAVVPGVEPHSFAQTGTASEPVRYMGGVAVDTWTHDGRLRPAIGVENRQVMRANRTHPEWADGYGWTYNHAANLAYWNGKFYLHYLSNPIGEHQAPGQTLVTVSADGLNWQKPVVVFPPYKLPDGSTAMMHQRMGFHVAPNGRLLVLGFYGKAPNPFNMGGIGRVVREAYKDGSYGPIYFIRYSRHAGWNESNTSYPYFTQAKDAGFVEACHALLANKLVTLNWWQEEQNNADDFYALEGNYQAFNYYHRPDGKVVGLWKWSLAALSEDEGKSWSKPERMSTLIMDGAKVWGQRTSDRRYALVYNPMEDSQHRWPLAIITGDDGIHFDDMLAVHGEVPPRRFVGRYKDYGPQYTRGIAEGNGMPLDGDLWLAYSVNKEDMWISRVPVPVRDRVTLPVTDTFDRLVAGGAVPGWNLYSPLWAPVTVVEFPSANNKSLELRDKDPYDYAKAVRVFPETKRAIVRFRIYPAQNSTGELQIDVLDRFGNRPVRLAFEPGGRLSAADGGKVQMLGTYKANTWYDISLLIDALAGKFTVSVNGKTALKDAGLAEDVKTIERLCFRTGSVRTLPTRRTVPVDEGAPDLANADQPVPEAVFRIDDVSARPLRPSIAKAPR